MSFDIPDEVARAIKLDACARYRGAPSDDARPLYGIEGHSRRSRFWFHCSRELAEILIRDIEAASAKSLESKFREHCESAIAAIRKELGAPVPQRSHIWPMVSADGTRANGS